MKNPTSSTLLTVFFLLIGITLLQACSSDEAATNATCSFTTTGSLTASTSTTNTDPVCYNTAYSVPYTEGLSHSGERTDSNCNCPSGVSTSHASGVPDWIKNNFCCVTTTMESGDTIVKIQFTGQPAHKSHYWGSSDACYESAPSVKQMNPNSTSAQGFTLKVPKSPSIGSGSGTATPFSAVGVAVNGASFFNNQAAPGDDLTNEIKSMDFGNGHPTDTGSYHYHIEPCYLSNNDSRLIGIMADGFPIYGQKDPDTGTAASCLTTAVGDHTIDASEHCITATDSSNGQPGYSYHILTSDPYVIADYVGTSPATLQTN